jgi:hypothetical protein
MEALKTIIDTSELFPADLLEGMMVDYVPRPFTEDIWLTKEAHGVPIAVAYCAPEKLTGGIYNLYLIAIHKDYQGNGEGTEMLSYI